MNDQRDSHDNSDNLDSHDKQAQRRSLLGGLGMAAIAGAALGSAPAMAQEAAPGFKPRRHDPDAWMDALPGDHRVFIDTDNVAGGTNALRYALNIINAHINAYEGKQEDMAIVICYRHASTTLGYNDAMWQKYGSTFTRLSRLPVEEGAPVATTNAQTATITDMASKGVQFAVCNSATTMLSGLIAREAGIDAATVHAELAANLIPNARLVPAGVMALTRAQEYGYSFLYSAA